MQQRKARTEANQMIVNYDEIAEYYDKVRGKRGGRMFRGSMQDILCLCRCPVYFKDLSNLDNRCDCSNYNRNNAVYELHFEDSYNNRNSGSNFFILDIGCGTGQYTLELAHILGHSSARVVGLDSSRGMVERARQKDLCSNVHWIIGDAEKLPFKQKTFNAIYLTFVIHHIKRRAKAFRDFKRVLKSNGRLVIMTSSHARLRRTPYSLFPGVFAIDRMRFPTIPVLMRELKRAGFRNICHKLVVYGSEVLSLKRMLKNINGRFISTFTLMSQQDFENGCEQFKKIIKERYSGKIRRTVEANFVYASR